jgi:hypothetical protein
VTGGVVTGRLAWRRRIHRLSTLLQLEAAVRGIQITQLPPADRARFRLFARLGRGKDQAIQPGEAADGTPT